MSCLVKKKNDLNIWILYSLRLSSYSLLFTFILCYLFFIFYSYSLSLTMNSHKSFIIYAWHCRSFSMLSVFLFRKLQFSLFLHSVQLLYVPFSLLWNTSEHFMRQDMNWEVKELYSKNSKNTNLWYGMRENE
jgi:hypothetical protein